MYGDSAKLFDTLHLALDTLPVEATGFRVFFLIAKEDHPTEYRRQPWPIRAQNGEHVD